MTNKYLEKCSTNLAVKWMQTTTALILSHPSQSDYHQENKWIARCGDSHMWPCCLRGTEEGVWVQPGLQSEKPCLKQRTDTKMWEALVHGWWEGNLCGHYGTQYGGFSLQNSCICHLAVTLLGIHSEDCKSGFHRDRDTSMFIAASPSVHQ